MFIKGIRIRIATIMLCVIVTILANIGTIQAAQPLTQSPQNNLLKVGDKINIIVEGEDDLSGFYTINSAGMVDMPLIGNIFIAGKTTYEAKNLIIQKLQDGYLVKPDVFIKENPQVNNPEKTTEKTTEKTEKKKKAQPNKILKHAQHRDKAPHGKRATHHTQKEKLCKKKTVYIVGSVRNPGRYTLPYDAGHILNIVALAGGYTDAADTSSFELVRNIDGKYYRKHAQSGALNYKNGDIVIIGKR